MKRFILGIVGMASIFLAANVFAAGTATVKLDTATITTLTTTTNTTTTDNITSAAITNGTVSGQLNVQTTFRINGTDTTKAAAFTDNQGSKMDSGSSNVASGSVTVTTSLTACDRVFVQQVAFGSGSVNWITTTSGAGFTAQGYYGTDSIAYIGTGTIHWLAIDE